MRIVITHTDFRLYWPARLNALSQFLHAKGHALEIVEISGKGSPYSFAGGTQCVDSLDWTCLFPSRPMESISSAEASAALYRELDTIRPDVVMAGAIAFPSGATAVRWAKEHRKVVIIFDDARIQDVPRPWFVNHIKKRIYDNVDAVLCPAPSHAPSFEEWGVARERIFYGLNVVDNEWFAEKAGRLRQNREQVRDELKLPERFILGVGRLIAKKNWVGLVESFMAVRHERQNIGWSLVLVGDGPVKADIEEKINGAEDNSIIMRPFVSQEVLCGYYSLASALTLPSFGETWGLVVNEAMACGLPVLVSEQCGCAATLVESGDNGYSFLPDSPEEIEEALVRFMALREDKRASMGNRSREIIDAWPLERFSQGAWEAVQYALGHPRSKTSILSGLIVRYWKGRYRPI